MESKVIIRILINRKKNIKLEENKKKKKKEKWKTRNKRRKIRL